MKRILILTLGLFFISCQNNPSKLQNPELDRMDIEQVLFAQAEAWNKGDLEGFMDGYWNSDQLTFIGSRGLTRGWTTTLENYKKSYPDLVTMGKLKFDVLQLSQISGNSYYMVGRYTLKRAEDEPTGIFMLIWKKINGKWTVIADQTCS